MIREPYTRVVFVVSKFPLPGPGCGLWMEVEGRGLLGIPSWFTSVVRLMAAAFPGLQTSNLGVMCIHSLVQPIMTSCSFSVMFFRSTPSCCIPKPNSGPGSNYLTHTCTLLTSSFLSTTFPLTVIFFFFPFLHIVVRILFLKHHFHHTPPLAAPSCIKSKLQVSASKPPLTAQTIIFFTAGLHSSQANVLTLCLYTATTSG